MNMHVIIHFLCFSLQRYGWHGTDDVALQETFDAAVGMYPWLDTMRDVSVTEVEFCHGHLNNPGVLPAIISFRSKVSGRNSNYSEACGMQPLKRGRPVKRTLSLAPSWIYENY